MAKESSIQSTVLEYLNRKPGCRAENVSGNSSQSGRPDINGCYKGRMFKIEMKSDEHGNIPTKKQLFELLTWQKVGAIVMVAYDLEFIETAFHIIDMCGVNRDIPDFTSDIKYEFCCCGDSKHIEKLLEEYDQ